MMAGSKALPLLFLLALVTLSSAPAMATSKFDFFYLTLMWPGAYCNSGLFSKCCRPTTGKPALDFFVQSLETYDSSNGEPVTGCSTDCRFSVNALRKLIDDLYAYWTDVSCPSNNGRQQWENVWCSYGTCSNFNETYYFQRALALRAQVDLLSLLKANGIVPSSDKLYKLEDIQDALIPTLGFSTVVECNKKWVLGESQLYKIRICVSSDAKTIISCPIQKSSSCGSKVKFLPFNPKQLPVGSAHNMANPIEMTAAIDMDM
ncbi:ribonuclease 3-like [Phoenix dactylifera]|uniref:Ribonuclease 3-like n=1 Tax=Phoenix dactylifera TaxID=42345 RepID=A0A8B7C4R5_PHODC|nr:ribonuclease 3-like [Phoenix dactylifera]